jgi:hypothetical protein
MKQIVFNMKRLQAVVVTDCIATLLKLSTFVKNAHRAKFPDPFFNPFTGIHFQQPGKDLFDF